MKLEPCVFCEESKEYIGEAFGEFVGTCGNCKSTGPVADNEIDAIKLWNKPHRLMHEYDPEDDMALTFKCKHCKGIYSWHDKNNLCTVRSN